MQYFWFTENPKIGLQKYLYTMKTQMMLSDQTGWSVLPLYKLNNERTQKNVTRWLLPVKCKLIIFLIFAGLDIILGKEHVTFFGVNL